MMQGTVTVLGIETSCDETAAAVVRLTDGRAEVLSEHVASQTEEHALYGGVVPEIAARAHVETIEAIAEAALAEAGMGYGDLTGVAATAGPGLVGGVMVGLSFGKAVALARGLPLVAVNHLEGHAVSARLGAEIAYPFLLLLVSGGHCQLLEVAGVGACRRLGSTIDDAAGEAFDKVARFLGLGYPGGPAIDREAVNGNPEAIHFPRAMMNDGLDVSFSGLKTSVMNHVRKHPDVSSEDVAASFQAAVVDVLVTKARRAAQQVGAKGLVLAGGVAANSLLREQFLDACVVDGIHGFLPSREMCTDNAAMIAAAGWHRLRSDGPTSLDCGAFPNLKIPGLT